MSHAAVEPPTTPAAAGTWRITRDPALVGGTLLAAVQVALTLVDWTPDQAALINAFATAVVGFVVALAVRSDRWVPALLGLIQSASAVVVGFGLHWTPEQQAAVMLLATSVAAVATRTQVTAPVPAAVAVPRGARP
jgi:hypothetical protein